MAGKSLDELNLNDDTLPVATSNPTSTDPRGEAWYRFSKDIEDLLATGRATFAEDTLRSIQTTVEKTHRVTDGQRRAVDNIERAAARPRRFGRRYEGYR
jgi:hypothetical protein